MELTNRITPAGIRDLAATYLDPAQMKVVMAGPVKSTE
jgi:predicted Zn-dependent peptidase